MRPKIRRLLVANRGEIAIRLFRAASELGISTIGIYSTEDRLSLHRFKADESYQVGTGRGPIEAYLDIDDIVRIARDTRADAVHPGYGFLSERPEFAEACAEAGLLFVGPPPAVMRRLGNKIEARRVAEQAGVPVVPASGALPADGEQVRAIAAALGYPLMLKASWGGGGRGMRVIEAEGELAVQLSAARREAEAAFGKDELYLERLVRRARHVEVQILGDLRGTLIHLFERDCSIQRRHQKVVERAPAPYLSPDQRSALCDAALRIGHAVGYSNAGTVEFLFDVERSAFYFIEVNPRIQVEHTVTEQVTGIDLVQAQIRIAEGAAIGAPDSGLPGQEEIRLNGHAIQCRITTEDARNKFLPDYGRITAYRGASGFGIRRDGGTAYAGAVVTRFYDPLLEKVTAWAPTEAEAIARMDRALREFRIRGVATNIEFLERLLNHERFRNNSYTTRFIDETPELFHFPPRRDRASRLLHYLGDIVVNGHPDLRSQAQVAGSAVAVGAPAFGPLAADGAARLPTARIPGAATAEPPPGTRQRLQELGPEGFSRWMRESRALLITDTTLRDAHQSLLATRLRSHDMLAIAPFYARALSRLFSLECWGGATFDVALRFLKEDPWERLEALRARIPNILLQMLFRASNAVGYSNYPDNVVRFFVRQAAEAGVDLFRIFDSLNWAENMRVSIEAVRESGKLCEAAICYTGDMLDPARAKYDLRYYVTLAKELERLGAHILGIKDMAGLCKPEAARQLITALRNEIGIPIHFHTHDTSGIAAASVLAASEAGVDAIDAAMDSMSGLTSQPNLGSLVAALGHSPRNPGLDPQAISAASHYWETVRGFYRSFEGDFRAGTADVYRNEIPGGQYTNLRQQARALGIEERWPEITEAYAEVNRLFGDVIKVTPTSKVVGDMALMMVSSGLSIAEVADPAREIAFPDSVVGFFRGDIGQPMGGFPPALQRKVLREQEPIAARPGELLAAKDIDAERTAAEHALQRHVGDRELAAYLMYPKVFLDYAKHRREYGDVSVLPTPAFFHGLEPGVELAVDLEPGKTIVIRQLAIGELDDQGSRALFFELNGQPRIIRIEDRAASSAKRARRRCEDGNPNHVPAPLPGRITSIAVQVGESVRPGDILFSIEAMKMETSVHAERAGQIEEIVAAIGTVVEPKDLVIVLK